MEIPIYQIDVFTTQVFKGNPAAVCLLQAWLPDNILQAIAAENYLPETSFVVKKNDEYDIRWFTPAEEVDLCGHATLAAAYVLLKWVHPWLNDIVFHSASGELTVKRQPEDRYLLDLPARPATACPIPEGMDIALGVMPRHLLKTDKAYLAVVESERQVRYLKPDIQKLAAIGCHKVIVTAPGDRADFVSRYFKTKGPIHEDPVTGIAHCTLMPFWSRRLGKLKLTAKQVSERSGDLLCELKQDRILLTSAATAYLQGVIMIPDEI